MTAMEVGDSLAGPGEHMTSGKVWSAACSTRYEETDMPALREHRPGFSDRSLSGALGRGRFAGR